MGFWDELEADITKDDFNIEDVSGDRDVLPAKDYFCQVDSWEFGKSSKKETPGCFIVANIIAPIDGENVQEVKGRKIFINLWLSKAALKWTIKAAQTMCGKEIKSLSDLQSADLKANVFKLVKNKVEDYEGSERFVPGFINALNAREVQDLSDISPSDSTEDSCSDEDISF